MNHNKTHARQLDCIGVFDISNGLDPERAAMLLALSRNREEEERLKSSLAGIPGMRFAVTEIGGFSDTLHAQITPRVVGTCLSQGVLCRCASQVHALLHAIVEAGKGVCLDRPIRTSMSLKIGIVHYNNWLAVAIFGESAFHRLTNHRRAGLGVMHINGDAREKFHNEEGKYSDSVE